MFSSNRLKIFLVFVLLLCQSCGFWRSKTDVNASPAAFVPEELKSAIPFSNKEPGAFQTEIVLTADGFEEKTFLAKSGASRLVVFDFQTASETGVLHLSDNQSFLVAPSRKIYAETEKENFAASDQTLDESLTAEWLNKKPDAKFERLAAQNDLTKYRVNLDDAVNSEIIIFVDEKIGLPVRQEFYSGDGEQKTLTATIELKNFSLQTDANFFRVPTDYRKMTAQEFRETMRRERLKN